MSRERNVALGSLALLAVIILFLTGTAGPKTYWHFTFKAFVHLPETRAVEWAWVTMVEYDRPKAYPSEAETIRQAGGVLRGTVLAFVRGAAWRSSFRYEKDVLCNDGPSKEQVYWEESESDSVFCIGEFFEPRPYHDGSGRVTLGPEKFRLGFTTRKFLQEDGRWLDPKSQAQVFVGPIGGDGRTAERMKGRPHLQPVNYGDVLKHFRRCGHAWAENYLTAFGHFQHDPLEDIIPDVGQSNWGAVNSGAGVKNQILYDVYRTTSREHPHWKQKYEWAGPIIE